MARSGSCPIRSLRCLSSRASARWRLATTRFGAHLYALGGNAEGARLAGIRTDLVMIGAHVVCSLMAGLSGLYLASRLRSGAPWVGRDGVYDLESIAVVVIGGTLLAGGQGRRLGNAGGRPAVRDAGRYVQHDGRLGLSQACDARRDRRRRGRRLYHAHARPCRMTIALKEIGPGSRAVAAI